MSSLDGLALYVPYYNDPRWIQMREFTKIVPHNEEQRSGH